MPQLLALLAGFFCGVGLTAAVMRRLHKNPLAIPWPDDAREAAREYGQAMAVFAFAADPEGAEAEAAYCVLPLSGARKVMDTFQEVASTTEEL